MSSLFLSRPVPSLSFPVRLAFPFSSLLSCHFPTSDLIYHHHTYPPLSSRLSSNYPSPIEKKVKRPVLLSLSLSLFHRIHISIHIHTLALQIFPRLLNLRHQLLVGLRNVVEGENSVAEFAQEIGAEGDEGPEGELF